MPSSCSFQRSHFLFASVTALISAVQLRIYLAQMRDGFVQFSRSVVFGAVNPAWCIHSSAVALVDCSAHCYSWMPRGACCFDFASVGDVLVVRLLSCPLRLWGTSGGFCITGALCSGSHATFFHLIAHSCFPMIQNFCRWGEYCRCWFMYISLHRCTVSWNCDSGVAVSVSWSSLSLIATASCCFLRSRTISGSSVGFNCQIRVSECSIFLSLGFLDFLHECSGCLKVTVQFSVHGCLIRVYGTSCTVSIVCCSPFPVGDVFFLFFC